MTVNDGNRTAAADEQGAPWLHLLDALGRGRPLMVFGYGSLMWNPGFPHASRRPALLRGYHRRFCIYSHRYRGSPERPGVVLGLDRGGSCRGILFEIEPRHAEQTAAYLWDREMVTNVYRPSIRTVEADGRTVRAACFLVDRDHGQYCGRLDDCAIAEMIRQGVGQSGPNVEYLDNTIAHLSELGIRDRGLEAIARAVYARV